MTKAEAWDDIKKRDPELAAFILAAREAFKTVSLEMYSINDQEVYCEPVR